MSLFNSHMTGTERERDLLNTQENFLFSHLIPATEKEEERMREEENGTGERMKWDNER